mgnify:FL=1
MKKENFIIVGITMIIVTISVSLAYFAAKIIGTPKDIDLAMKDLYVEFTDNTAELNASGITPGWTYEKTFTIENKSESEYKYNIIIKDLVNTFVTNNLQYKITNTSSNGGYSMSEFENITKSETKKKKTLAYNVSISSGVKQVYKLELRYLDSDEQNGDMGKKFSGKLFITEGTEEPVTLFSQILKDNPTRSTRDTYDSVFTSDTTGTLFTATEKNVHNTTDTTVYYYAGNTTKNWVKFAGYYWRIIRTNADGSIRMLYSGTSHDTTSGYINSTTYAFNTSYNSPKYVGYMYGENDDTLANARTNTNNSTIKTAIDNWYASNMTSYTKYLSTTAVYCNDRTEQTSGTYNIGSKFGYAPRARVNTNYAPTYDCTETSDAFSGSNTSAKLTYPIALMTVDEIMRAGGKDRTSLTSPYAWYYLNSANGSITGDTVWQLLSPCDWGGSYAFVFVVRGSSSPGSLSNGYGVSYSGGVRPVISLKSDVLYKSGDGSAESPYEIQETPDTISDVVKANAVNENGYRYEGSDPNNYIQMQKSDGTTEMWRIIGLFPDGESGENVIRVRKVGYESAAYDTNQTNHWPNTTLYTTLSSTYTLVNYKNTVNYKMYLGGSNNLYNYTSANLYDMERMLNSKGEAGKTSSTSYNSATTYVGSVGLMYPSDYGYAVLASDCARTINPSNYSGTSACYTNNWLYQGSSDIQWLISPKPSLVNIACIVNGSGYVLNFNSTAVVTNSGSFSPVMALKSDVVVTGSGTQSDPYVMK